MQWEDKLIQIQRLSKHYKHKLNRPKIFKNDLLDQAKQKSVSLQLVKLNKSQIRKDRL